MKLRQALATLLKLHNGRSMKWFIDTDTILTSAGKFCQLYMICQAQ